MSDIYVVGVGMTPFGKFIDRTVKDLSREAVNNALTDAGAAKEDICLLYTSPSPRDRS